MTQTDPHAQSLTRHHAYRTEHHTYHPGAGLVPSTTCIDLTTQDVIGEIDSRVAMVELADQWCAAYTGKGLDHWLEMLYAGRMISVMPWAPVSATPGEIGCRLIALLLDLERAGLGEVSCILCMLSEHIRINEVRGLPL